MKKRAALLLTILVIMSLFPHVTVFAESLSKNQSGIYILPASLKQIEEEAFAGTAVETAVFPDGLLSIENKAFENASLLTDVYIPKTVKYIADLAFPHNKGLAVHGDEDSYAREWAKGHAVAFITEGTAKTLIRRLKIRTQRTERYFLHLMAAALIISKIIPMARDFNISRRPQDRPELNPIDYRFP